MDSNPIIGHIEWKVTVGATGAVVAGGNLDLSLDRFEITTTSGTKGSAAVIEIGKELRNEFKDITSPEAMTAMKDRLMAMQGGMASFKEPAGPSWFKKILRLDDEFSLTLNEHPDRAEKSGFALAGAMKNEKPFSFEPFDIEDGVAKPLKSEGRILCQTAVTPHGTEISRLVFESEIGVRMFKFDPINPPNIRKLPHPDWIISISIGSEITWPYLDRNQEMIAPN